MASRTDREKAESAYEHIANVARENGLVLKAGGGIITIAHPMTQVLPGFLSHAFTDAVNACGLYDDMKPEERPTLHEVRSLGGRIYEAMGRPKEFIQSLYGHAAIDMTEHYLDDGKIVWSMASADMDLSVAAATKLRE